VLPFRTFGALSEASLPLDLTEPVYHNPMLRSTFFFQSLTLFSGLLSTTERRTVYHEPSPLATFFFALALAVVHRPIVAVHIIVAGKTTTIILHIVRMILTTTIIAQCPTARVNRDALAVLVHHSLRLAFRRVHHVEHSTGKRVWRQHLFFVYFLECFQQVTPPRPGDSQEHPPSLFS
jgi:hypothetical protein